MAKKRLVDDSHLPDEPSELLTVALEDFEKCKTDPKYRIAMSVWMEADEASVRLDRASQ